MVARYEENILTITKDNTIKELRKAMRSMPKDNYGAIILVEGWGQIKKICNSYAVGPLPENDDSDILTDYSAWTYCCRESWVLDWIRKDTGMKEC